MKINTATYKTIGGTIDYTFTNDFVFRAILQHNNTVLKALICSLLHLSPESVKVRITNPINLGATFSNKDFILDIRVSLNTGSLIDLEMQVINEHNWQDRSISYAARNFDHLNRGENYLDAKPVHSIGFLDFTLFPDEPEFYATYQLKNIKTGRLYSSKFSIHVVDLTQTKLATEEDRKFGLDLWAKLFKARTWEELRMIAKADPNLQQAAQDLYHIDGDELMRQQAQARADAEFWERHFQAEMQRQKNTITEQKNTITARDEEIRQLKAQLSALNKK